jgi:sulfite oxidase
MCVGNAGARFCKYLERIQVTEFPCCDACNWKQYAVHAPDTPLFKLAEFERYATELKQDPAVQEMPVQSFITFPSAGDIIAAPPGQVNSITVKGIAWGGGGAGINRVDVSLDGGKNFTKADVLPTPIPQRRGAHWSWVFFEKTVPFSEEMSQKLKTGQPIDLELTSKALNTSWNVQPENPEPNRNPHGCCVNHWYRVPIKLCPNSEKNIPAPIGDFANKPSGGKFRTPFRNQDKPGEAAQRRKTNSITTSASETVQDNKK